MNAKEIKMFPYLFLSDYDYTIWLDSSCKIIDPHFAMELLKYLPDSGIAALGWSQGHKTIIEHEIEDCIRLKLVNPNVAHLQANNYRKEGLVNEKLYGCTCLIRDNRNEKISRLCQTWWEHNQKYTSRDQISFPYVLWKYGIECGKIPYNEWRDMIYLYDHAIRRDKLR